MCQWKTRKDNSLVFVCQYVTCSIVIRNSSRHLGKGVRSSGWFNCYSYGCLTQLWTIFQFDRHNGKFLKWNTRRKPSTFCKYLTNIITYSSILYTSLWIHWRYYVYHRKWFIKCFFFMSGSNILHVFYVYQLMNRNAKLTPGITYQWIKHYTFWCRCIVYIIVYFPVYMILPNLLLVYLVQI